MVDFLVFWGVCFLITVIIGAKKGNPIAAALLAIFLGPVAVIIALLSGDKNRIACPFCAEQIQKKAKVCPFCRNDV